MQSRKVIVLCCMMGNQANGCCVVYVMRLHSEDSQTCSRDISLPSHLSDQERWTGLVATCSHLRSSALPAEPGVDRVGY